MSETSIAWTDYTFNPWWGCQRVSPGCEHCYAETFANRLGMDLWGPTADRRFFDDRHWAEPIKWWRRRLNGDARHRVFCASMADVFEDLRMLDGQRERLWALIESTPELTWQLLTKRPENMRRLAPARWAKAWPDNVWALATAEDQERLLARLGHLLAVPARIRGISWEPGLGPLDFIDGPLDEMSTMGEWSWLGSDIHWVIAGGESGHGARPFDLQWARELRDACRLEGAAFFMKQLGEQPTNSAQEDGSTPCGAYGQGKRDDPAEWPEDLRVREFPG